MRCVCEHPVGHSEKPRVVEGNRGDEPERRPKLWMQFIASHRFPFPPRRVPRSLGELGQRIEGLTTIILDAGLSLGDPPQLPRVVRVLRGLGRRGRPRMTPQLEQSRRPNVVAVVQAALCRRVQRRQRTFQATLSARK